MTTLHQASHQWASRPDDERFTSLFELRDKVQFERDHSRSTIVSNRKLLAEPVPGDERSGLQIAVNNGRHDVAFPTHWSFGQIAQLAAAPAGYMRTLPAPIAADCINYGLRFTRDVEEVGVLISDNGTVSMRAATGPGYGRVWNAEVAGALVDKFGDGVNGQWRVPGEFGKAVQVTKANTTLFASDRDLFVFLADEENRINVPDRRNGKAGSMARGFFVWNSEVGSRSIGAAFFLFDYVCCNRIVWGAEQYKEIRLRHSAGAPDRWLEEISPVLIEYSKAAAGPVEDAIKAAQAAKLDDLDKFLAGRFTKGQAAAFKAAHERDEARPMETVWDVATGMTAYARTLPYQDQRVEIERQAGKVLDLVAQAA